MPSDVPFRKVKKMLKDRRYVWARTTGSHHIYEREGDPDIMSIPVHNGKVKYYYVKKIGKK